MCKTVVIAAGCRSDGHREVLGVDIGDSENEMFRTEFPPAISTPALRGEA